MRVFWHMVLALAALWLPSAAEARAKDSTGVEVTVSRSGAGWVIDYRFAHAAPVWFFPRSANALDKAPWRPRSWTVETPGVTLEHVGHYDMLAGNGAPLRHVRIRMKPYAEPLIGDYTPALAFSDGNLALYSEQFFPMPAASREAVVALPGDLNGVELETTPATLRLVDSGRRLLFKGRATEGRLSVPLGDAGDYVYSGDAALTENAAFAGVIDAGLPAWVRGQLDDFTPRLFALYRERLGAPATGRPIGLVAWQGAEKPGWSLGGSVLPGTIVMQLSGKRVLASDPQVLAQLQWFLGHESSHFWLGQTVRYSRRAESWITEGGADLLAIRAIETLAPGYDAHEKLQQELDECLQRVGPGEALGASDDRNQFRAYYACGALMMLAAESVSKRKGGDLFGFVRALIGAKHADGSINADDWFTAFAAAGANPAIAVRLRDYVDKGDADPRGMWTAIFDSAGIAWWMDGQRITLGVKPAA
ncbi:hypothetical protein [Sphingomonas sp.]|uniref:hypothetical protein n=1 Tax=Sphingomonas sp. TaxID=28214 RepID=UPI001B0C026F|nr:hypothetical protein [Sphingomonas sp.]MBO9713815.1 hypothetical protein [Sphingomonas sp.]